MNPLFAPLDQNGSHRRDTSDVFPNREPSTDRLRRRLANERQDGTRAGAREGGHTYAPLFAERRSKNGPFQTESL
jgi:hypothetical protein